MIEELATPIVVETDRGPVTCTHRGFGFTVQPWSKETPLLSYTTLGTLHPTTKRFRSVGPEGDEYAPATHEEFEKLLAPSGPKKAGIFRTDDVKTFHNTKRKELNVSPPAQAPQS